MVADAATVADVVAAVVVVVGSRNKLKYLLLLLRAWKTLGRCYSTDSQRHDCNF